MINDSFKDLRIFVIRIAIVQVFKSKPEIGCHDFLGILRVIGVSSDHIPEIRNVIRPVACGFAQRNDVCILICEEFVAGLFKNVIRHEQKIAILLFSVDGKGRDTVMVLHVRIGNELIPKILRDIDIFFQHPESDQGIHGLSEFREQPAQAVKGLMDDIFTHCLWGNRSSGKHQISKEKQPSLV